MEMMPRFIPPLVHSRTKPTLAPSVFLGELRIWQDTRRSSVLQELSLPRERFSISPFPQHQVTTPVLHQLGVYLA